MRKYISGILLALAAFVGMDAMNLGGFSVQQATSPVLQQIATLSSVAFSNFSNPASQSLVLVNDPGDGCAIELVSITGMRIFASEAWKNVNEGFEVRYENSTGLSLIASFSKGFSSGGELNTTASPSWVVRYPIDTMASPSEPLILTASSSQTIDGDTYFKFNTAFRRICTSP